MKERSRDAIGALAVLLFIVISAASVIASLLILVGKLGVIR